MNHLPSYFHIIWYRNKGDNVGKITWRTSWTR